jgi:hypothetical protein
LDYVKLDGKSTIRILDLTCVSQTSHNVILKKESEMYKDMTMMAFNKEVWLLFECISVNIIM